MYNQYIDHIWFYYSTVSNLTLDDNDVTETRDSNGDTPNVENVTTPTRSVPPSTSEKKKGSTGKKRKTKEKEEPDEIDLGLIEFLNRKRESDPSTANDTEDADKAFLLSLLPFFLTMTNAQKMSARIKIMQIVQDLPSYTPSVSNLHAIPSGNQAVQPFAQAFQPCMQAMQPMQPAVNSPTSSTQPLEQAASMNLGQQGYYPFTNYGELLSCDNFDERSVIPTYTSLQ